LLKHSEAWCDRFFLQHVISNDCVPLFLGSTSGPQKDTDRILLLTRPQSSSRTEVCRNVHCIPLERSCELFREEYKSLVPSRNRFGKGSPNKDF